MNENNTRIIITAEDRASAALGNITQAVGSLSQALPALSAALSVGALIGSIKSIVDLGDEMNDLTQKVGINVKDLATWKLAAMQSGTSIESVAKGVKGLSGFMTENSDALAKAGITATDANGALIQIADLFQSLPDGVTKTALAVKLFGKEGMSMIPMLNLGSSGLQEAADKAKAYGEKMALLAPLADKFNDQMAELALHSKEAGLSMATSLLPSMTALVEQLIAGKQIAGGWTSAMWEFGVLLDPTKGIGSNLSATRAEIEKLNVEMAKGTAQNLADGGQTDLSEIEKKIPLLQRRLEFLKLMQRQEVMSNAGKLGDYRDARDLRQKTDPAGATKRAKIILGKDQGEAEPLAVGLSEEKARHMMAYEMEALGLADKLQRKMTEQEDAMRLSMIVMPESARKTAAEIMKSDKEMAAEKENLNRQLLEGRIDAGVYEASLSKLSSVTEKHKATTTELIAEQDALNATWQYGSDQALQSYLDKVSNVATASSQAMTHAFSTMEDDLVAFVKTGKLDFKSLADSIVTDLIRIQIQQSVTKPLAGVLQDAGGLGGLVSSFFGGGRAAGGSVTPGRFYVVGEQGPEILMPNSAGTVLPNSAITSGAGSSVVIHQTVNIDSRSDQASIMSAMVTAKNAAVAEIRNAQRRGLA